MIVVLGSSGRLGSVFMEFLGSAATGVTRRELDLRDHDRISQFLTTHRPRTIINCAAYTDVDSAEANSETARSINAVAVAELARHTRSTGAKLVTFSTDYVFDGEKEGGYVESDATGPLNMYGRTKRDGEVMALDVDPDALVVRTSWLHSLTGPNFVTQILAALEERSVDVVSDQVGCPTFAEDLVPATLRAIDLGVSGVLHLANSTETTWFHLARLAARLAGFPQNRVRPILSAELDRSAIRPANSVLVSERLVETGLEILPPIDQNLISLVERAT